MIALLLLAQLAIATPPRAAFVATCTPGTLIAKFDASASTRGSGGPIVSYKFNWADGRIEVRRAPNVANTWKAAGKYVVKLTVVDSVGQSSLATQRTVTLPCAVPAKPDTVFRVDTIRTPKPAPDTVKLPCVCDTTVVKPPPPPPPPTPTPSGETWAELPRVYLDTKLVPPTGATIAVPAGGDLQAALTRAQPGDVITLANGGTWSGNFTLPNKAGSSWITIRPANMANVPAEGTRMSPAVALAANLPRIVSTSNQGALATDFGAHHYRLVALEVTVPSTINNTGLIRLGTSYETKLSEMPHDLILDRMYIHGTTTGNTRRCVALNGASTAVIDSYVSDCHENGGDAQAVGGWSGPGPFKIVNNYLEASGENVMFGGGDPGINGVIPSDIEIRRNHFFKPASWIGGPWLVKNLFELKNAQRVLVEGNVFDGSWWNGQGGSAIVLKSVNQGGSCTWCVAKDVTFRLNIVRNTGAGFALSGHDVATQSIMTRVTITNNLVTGIDQPPFRGDGRGFLINNDPIDLVIAHNTVLDPTLTAVTFGGPTTELPTRLTVRDNIVGAGQYGVNGNGMGAATAIATFLSGGWRGNVLIVAPADVGGTLVGTSLSTLAGVGFAADFSLSATSRFKGKATTGRDVGANIGAVLSATAGAVQP